MLLHMNMYMYCTYFTIKTRILQYIARLLNYKQKNILPVFQYTFRKAMMYVYSQNLITIKEISMRF